MTDRTPPFIVTPSANAWYRDAGTFVEFVPVP
jgi:hypothetical protein